MIDPIIVAIPSYNCANQIGRVVADFTESALARIHEVWIIDNRSTDATIESARAAIAMLPLEWRTKFRVLQNEENVNLGGTHKVAFHRAADVGARTVVILHGDDQARAAEITDLLTHSDRVGGATVLGSRFMHGSRLVGYDAKRVAGNRVLNALYSLVALRWLTDLGSGLNAFLLADLDLDRVDRFGDTLSFNYELTLDLVRRRVPFIYTPITWTESDQVSNARNVRIFVQAVRILTRWRLGREPNRGAAPAGRVYRCVEVDEGESE